MAASMPTVTLADDITCSICTEQFQDPMIIHCGHTFCRSCITECWKESRMNVHCPFCRASSPKILLIPNIQMENIVRSYKEYGLQSENLLQKMCTQHNKPLHLFCENDSSLLCEVCMSSAAHDDHWVLDVEDAATYYKKRLLGNRKNFKEELNNIQLVKTDGERPTQELLNEIQAKREEVVYGFQEQLKFLKEQKEHQLATLNDLEKEIEETMDDYTDTLESEISDITGLIREVEEKCRQPKYEFLENMGNILKRCKSVTVACYFPPFVSITTKERVKKILEESSAVQHALRKCREIILNSNGIKDSDAARLPKRLDTTGLQH